MMSLQTIALACLHLSLPLVHAQSRYADFQAPLEKDSDIVSANFPDVEGVELLSPAFLSPEGIPEGFYNGTSTATPLLTQGKPEFRHRPLPPLQTANM